MGAAGHRPVRIALVGVGGYGSTHLDGIRRLAARGRCGFAAVVIRDPARHAEAAGRLERDGVRIHGSFGDLLAREAGLVDLVVLATGIPEHAAQAEAALRSGFHVLCEKPAAGSYADALRMKEAADRGGRLLAIGFQNLYSSSIRRIQRLALSGTLGRPVSARGLVVSPRSAAYYGRNRWAGRMSLDGVGVLDSPIQNAAGHYLANLLFLAGPREGESVRPVTVCGENYRAAPIDGADTQCVRVTAAGGCRIDLGATHAASRALDIFLELRLERGRVLWRKGGGTEVFGADGALLERFTNEDPALEDRMLEDVIAAVEEGRSALCTIDNALAHAACVELLFRSAPIRGVDRRFVTEAAGGDGHPVAAIAGIEDLMEAMVRDGSSFSEAGAPWALAGSPRTAKELEDT